jgi:F-type H+-transporting ATPase subunit b
MTRLAEFWVAIAFVVFLLIILYYKVPSLITKALDDRANTIRKDLDEARRLREEAEKLLADYQEKHRNAGQEAQSIVDLARAEAQAFAQQTRASLQDSIERRTKLAEEKIVRAEAQAIDEVRATAVEVAVAAAERILRAKATSASGAALIDQGIRDLKGRLN